MKPEFYTKRGRLTAFGLACGYLEITRNRKTNDMVRLNSEHGVFHVVITKDYHVTCHSFNSIVEARKDFDKIKKKVLQWT